MPHKSRAYGAFFMVTYDLFLFFCGDIVLLYYPNIISNNYRYDC